MVRDVRSHAGGLAVAGGAKTASAYPESLIDAGHESLGKCSVPVFAAGVRQTVHTFYAAELPCQDHVSPTARAHGLTGMPVLSIHPIPCAKSSIRNSAIENPTRRLSAHTTLRLRPRSRTKNTRAEARLPRISVNATMTKIFIRAL
jgi:hypothetical protein